MSDAHDTKRIPKNDVLEFVVRDILRKRSVDSQKELAELVNRKFSDTGSSFRASPPRARAAALKVGAKVVIRTKSGDVPKKCPGCGHRLTKSYMRNLKGKDAIYAMKCPSCGYDGKLGHWLPSRYGFSRI